MTLSSVSKMGVAEFKAALGTLPDPKDGRDFKMRHKKGQPFLIVPEKVRVFKAGEYPVLPATAVKLPRKFDLRKKMSLIEDQGTNPWCAAFTVAGGLDFMHKIDSGDFEDFCEQWGYKEARKIAGLSGSARDGVYIRSVLKLAQKQGFLPQKAWNEVKGKPNKKGQKLTKLLANYKIATYASVSPRTIDNAKQTMLNFGPLYSAFRIYDGWRFVGRNGKITIPEPGERALGGHGVLIVGWDDNKGSFIIRNSWGDWGDDGYGYLPYEYFQRFCYSCWSAVDVKGSKDKYGLNDWEKFLQSWPKWLKRAFGVPF